MLATLFYLQGFNNCFNRQVKKPGATKVEDYTDWVIKTAGPCSFNTNDSITTSITANLADTLEPDYVLVSEDNINVSSRWFVIEKKRNLSGQYEVSLKRDLFADFWDDISGSPCYIEKATLSIDNPLIYNSENQSFNKIKTSETLLMDSTKTPWLCIYFNRNNTEGQAQEAKQVRTKADLIDNTDLTFDLETAQGLVGQELWGSFPESPILTVEATWNTELNEGDRDPSWYASKLYTFVGGNCSTQGSYEEQHFGHTTWTVNPDKITDIEDLQEAAQNFLSAEEITRESAVEYIRTRVEDSSNIINDLRDIGTKTVRDPESGTLYTIKFTRQYKTRAFRVNKSSSLYSELEPYFYSWASLQGPGIDYGTPEASDFPFFYKDTYADSGNYKSNFTISGTFEYLKVESVEVVNGYPINCTVSASNNRTKLTDAPWDMLAIPYFGEFWIKTGPNFRIGTYPNVARAIGQAIAEGLGSWVKDIQLLPFCPCMEYVSNGVLDITGLTSGVNYVPIYSEDPDETDALINVGVWCNQSSFRANIKNFTPITCSQDSVEFKIENECDSYRLCSPNYSGAFEFSATKNGGIQGFEVNCTYKPLQPYVHINPVFGGLYGEDFNDNRGLVCSGDWSMPYATSAWEEYKIQNKAYEEAHMRDIQNMETTHNIQREQQKTQAWISGITGTASGATSGGLIGSAGGPIGTAIGAAIGGTIAAGANAYGAIKDLEYSDRLYAESRSYAEDKWNLSLENIKALPNTVSNIGAFDVNFKYFPFLEYYTCTDVEKEALRKRLKYSGFTVNVIGTLGELPTGLDTFVQGQLIRYIGDGDYHLTASIADELHKGVYI